MAQNGDNDKKTQVKDPKATPAAPPTLTVKESPKVSVSTEGKVVKIAPYPIDCNLTKPEIVPPVVIAAKVIRLEEFGFVMKTLTTYFKMGDLFQTQFEIPVLKIPITEVARVVKTSESIEAYIGDTNKAKVLTVEMHFKAIENEHRKAIRNFLFKIGQKKPT